jgi:hypothetical protein
LVSSDEGQIVRIDCADCVAEGTAACDDCLVTFLLGREPHQAVVVDAAEARAMRMLQNAGLLPALRHRAAG